MYCGSCYFWNENGKNKKNESACNKGNCNFNKIKLNKTLESDSCHLKGSDRELIESINDKMFHGDFIHKTTFLKVYHSLDVSCDNIYDLIYVDYGIAPQELIAFTSQKHNVPEENVILTYLFGEKDRREVSICKPLSKVI